MMRIMTVIASISLLTLALPVEAQELWHGARTGMTPDEIREIFPAAVPLKRTHSHTFLRIPEIEFQGNPYIPIFVFKDGELVKVWLRYGGRRYQFSLALTSIYDPVIAALKSEFGKEADYIHNRKEHFYLEEHSWIIDGRKISVRLLDVRAGAGALHGIFYEPAVSGNLD